MTMDEPCPSETMSGNGTDEGEGRGIPSFTLPIMAVAMMLLLAIVDRKKE